MCVYVCFKYTKIHKSFWWLNEIDELPSQRIEICKVNKDAWMHDNKTRTKKKKSKKRRQTEWVNNCETERKQILCQCVCVCACVQENRLRSKSKATTRSNESRKRQHIEFKIKRDRDREDYIRNRVKEKKVEKNHMWYTVRPLDRQEDRFGIQTWNGAHCFRSVIIEFATQWEEELIERKGDGERAEIKGETFFRVFKIQSYSNDNRFLPK